MKRSKRGPYRMPRYEVVQPLNTSYRLIPLTKGQNAIVDAIDFEFLSQRNWSAHWNKPTNSFYAISGHRNALWMHKEILACKSGEEGDHINHDTLDNRRENLRKATTSQNRCNRRLFGNNKSGYIGVSLHKNGKWSAYVRHDRKLIHLGMFLSPAEAAKIRDAKAKELHGEFAYLNFP